MIKAVETEQSVTVRRSAVEDDARAPRPPAGWRELVVFRGRPGARIQLYVAIASFAAILLIWTAISASGLVAPQFLPAPLAVLGALQRLFTESGFARDILISIGRVWMAFAIAALMAIPLGILMSSFRIVGAIGEPVIDFIRYLPVPALVPLTIIWFGIGETSKIVLLWLGTFFQLVLLIADDAGRVPREYIETGRTLGAHSGQIMRDILFPAMAPSMVDNLRITLGWCWTYLVIAEIVAANTGIGYVIWAAKRYVQTDKVFAGILAIGIIGLATDQAVRAAHRRLFPYLR
jgi:NitT/TauT family transport system permease protein